MGTKVIVQVPYGKERDVLATAVELGGKVLAVMPEKIGAAGRINPARLLRHIRLSGLSIGENNDFSDRLHDPSYGRIFDFLRGLSFEQQSSLLSSFFSVRLRDPISGSRLGKFLAKINSVDWLDVGEEPEVEELQRISDEFYQRMNMPVLPVYLVKGDWDEFGKRIIEGFAGIGNTVTFNVKREMYVKNLNHEARVFLGDHRDMREATEAQRIVNSILSDLSHGHWEGRVQKLSYYGCEGLSTGDLAKMSAVEAVQADARLVAASLVLEKQLTKFGYDKGVVGEGLFNGLYDKGYVFIGPVGKQSIIFTPE